MMVIKVIDKITEIAALFSAWILFMIGMIVTYEVIMRKIFNSPTIWVDEMARFFLVWAVYLASAHILKKRELIIVELVSKSFGTKFFRCLEVFMLLVILTFSAVAFYFGAEVVAESIEMGRKTSSMLGVPKWCTESSVPVGFGLLLIQAIVELIKVGRGDEIAAVAEHKV